jgi:aspartyl-tRNA(Asn)/glutamyl-tRNA(Gln) amidotransferase subunit A
MSKSIIELSAIEIRDSFLAGEHTATEIIEAFINRINDFGNSDKCLNAFNRTTFDLARKLAKELDERKSAGEDLSTLKLAAVPIGIKDLINLEGYETTASSEMLKGHKSVYNATITEKVLAAGAIPLGKINLDQFAMGSSNETSANGPVKNPWDYSKVPGGSSGGSAAAVAANLCPLTFGTDTGGSIRQPAAFCGITGMKPTYGLVSRYGIIAFASSLDQAGPMTRDVKDNALLMEVMSGHDPKDSTSIKEHEVENYLEYLENNYLKSKNLNGLKIGIAKEFSPDSLNSEVKSKLEMTIEKLKELGAEIVEISLEKIKYGLAVYYIIAPAEASSNLSRYDGVRFGHRNSEAEDLSDLYLKSRAKFGDEVKRRIMLGTYALSSGYYDAYYLKAQQVRKLIFDDFMKAFSECDLILTPTCPHAAFEFGGKSDPLEMYLSDIMTVPVNLAGLPAISLNAGFDQDNMPIGMQLIGPALSEAKIYNAALALEETLAVNDKQKELALSL